MRKKCSSDREKLLKSETEGQEFIKNLRSLGTFVCAVKGQNNLGKRIIFQLSPGGFSDLIKLEQLEFDEFKLEYLIGI